MKTFLKLLLSGLIVLITQKCGASVINKEEKFDTGKFSQIQVPVILEESRSPSEEKIEPPQISMKNDIKFPSINTGELKNGLKVYHIEHSRLPIITVEMIFRAGSAFDPPTLQGLANFTGEMLKGGTKTRTSEVIAEEFESLGANLDILTSHDTTVLRTRCLKEHFENIMNILGDLIINPSFPDDEIENLRSREIKRLNLEASDPWWQASRFFYAKVYGNHPYSHYDATTKSISAITKKDILNFYKNHYTASNGGVAITGDIDFATAFRVIKENFGKLRRGKRIEINKTPVPERKKMEVVIVNRPGSVETVYKIGGIAIETANSQYPALELANTILGGSPASRLFFRIREKESNAYSIMSSCSKNLNKGVWAISGSTKTESTLSVITSILDEIEKFTQGELEEKEIKEAVSFITGNLALNMETTDDITELISTIISFDLPLNFWNNYLSALKNVSFNGLKDITKKYLDKNKIVVILVGEKNKIEKSLKNQFDVTVVETNDEISSALPQ